MSDSTQKEVAKLLADGRKCVADLTDCRERVANRDFQIGKQAERIVGFMVLVDNMEEQKRTLQADIVACDKQQAIKDKQILKLRTSRGLIIVVSAVAVIGAVVLGAVF